MIFKFVFEIVAVSGDNKLVIVLIASKYIYISATDAQVYTPFICPKEVCKNQI